MKNSLNWIVKVLRIVLDCLAPENAARRIQHERRSAGAKKGWQKRKARQLSLQLPDDTQ